MTKVHMHSCLGFGDKPCPGKFRLHCQGALEHRNRCPQCQDRHADHVLFDGPYVGGITS